MHHSGSRVIVVIVEGNRGEQPWGRRVRGLEEGPGSDLDSRYLFFLCLALLLQLNEMIAPSWKSYCTRTPNDKNFGGVTQRPKPCDHTVAPSSQNKTHCWYIICGTSLYPLIQLLYPHMAKSFESSGIQGRYSFT